MVATGTENVGVNATSRVAMLEFDCATAGDSGTSSYVLIPASENPNGLILLGMWAIITEVMAGSSEDQGVITVSDESDNSLDTFTASDAAADALGDLVLGGTLSDDLESNSTGGAWASAMVAAGEYVDAAVTQQTAGTPAGKMLVCVHYVPVPSAPK
jgi:hypothetical protein